MKAKASSWLRGLGALALGFMVAGTSLAQTTTTIDVRRFEVISVDGNTLVVRDQNGSQEYTVPDDFRFTVDGRQMSVKELKPGMKGTATVTTRTTVKPVVITEIKDGVVLSALPQTMIVQTGDGLRKRYTQNQLDERGIQIYKDGQLIRISALKEGDVLTAMIVSKEPPVVVTEQEVKATLDKAKADAPTKVAAATSPPPPAPSTAPSATPPSGAAPAPSAPAESSGMGVAGWVFVLAVLALAAYFLWRRKTKT